MAFALEQTAACNLCGEGDPTDHSFVAAHAFYMAANRDRRRPGLRPVELHSMSLPPGGSAHLVEEPQVSDDDDDDEGFALMSAVENGGYDEEDALSNWACMRCNQRLESLARQAQTHSILYAHSPLPFPMPEESPAAGGSWWQVMQCTRSAAQNAADAAESRRAFVTKLTNLLVGGNGSEAVELLKERPDVMLVLETFGKTLTTSSIRASCVEMMVFCSENSNVLREEHEQKRFMEMAIHDSTDAFVRHMVDTILPHNFFFTKASVDICLLSCCFMGNQLSKAQILLEAGAEPLEVSFEGITAFGYFCGYTAGTAAANGHNDVEPDDLTSDRWVQGVDVVHMFDLLLSHTYNSRPDLRDASSTAQLMQLLVGPHDGPVVKELLNPFSWASNACIMQKLLYLGFDVNMPMPGGENVYFQLSLRYSGPDSMWQRLHWLSLHCPDTAHVSDNGNTAITSLLQREVAYWEHAHFVQTGVDAIRQRVDNLFECVEFLAVSLHPMPYKHEHDYVPTEQERLIAELYKKHTEYSRILELLNTQPWM